MKYAIWITVLTDKSEGAFTNALMKMGKPIRALSKDYNVCCDCNNNDAAYIFAYMLDYGKNIEASDLIAELKKIFSNNNLKYLSMTVTQHIGSSSWAGSTYKIPEKESLPSQGPYRDKGIN